MATWIKKKSDAINSKASDSSDENFNFPDDVTFITSSDYLQHKDKVPVFDGFYWVYDPTLDGWVKTPYVKPSTSHISYTENETEKNNFWLWILGGVVVVGGGFILFGGKNKKKRK